MSQTTSFSVSNAAGAVVRAALNLVTLALASHSSGNTAPTETHPFMFWADTSASRMKMRNAANTDWITLPLSLTASGTVPDALAVLGALSARDVFLLGSLGAEWALDGDVGGSGAQLVLGPNVSGAPDQTYGLAINRATGKVTIGDGATAGAADHLEVNGGITAGAHGLTLPDGTLLPTAGVIAHHISVYTGTGSILSTSWFALAGSLQLTVTPQRATSKMLLLASVMGGCSGNGFWRVEAGGSPLESLAGSFTNAHGNLKQALARVIVNQAMMAVHTPGSTSPLTYRIAFKAESASTPIYVNRTPDAVGDATDVAGTCYLTVLELGGA